MFRGPLFILGNNRSGTSLLRLMLTIHKDVIIPPESHFLLWFYDKYKNWNWEINLLNKFINDLYRATKFETWEIDKNKLYDYLNKIKPKTYASLIECIYVYYGITKQKSFKVWGDKNSLWPEKLNILVELYPEAKFIHIVRDGRDIACSYKKINKSNNNLEYYPKLPKDIKKIASIWQSNMSMVNRFKQNIKESNFIEIKYEDLVLNTFETIEQLMGFLNLTVQNDIFEYYKLNERLGIEPEKFMKWKQKLNTPPDKNNIGKYKKELSERERTDFFEIAKHWLKKYKYV